MINKGGISSYRGSDNLFNKCCLDLSITRDKNMDTHSEKKIKLDPFLKTYTGIHRKHTQEVY